MDTYERLQEILDSHPSGAPKSKVFDEILKILFTPDEATLAIHMSFGPKEATEIAKVAGISPEKAETMLEAMADKVIISCRKKDEKRFYSLVPTIPGLFEFPFMQGGGTPMHEKLGRLWEEYHKEALGSAFSGNPTPLMRVVPLEISLESQTKIHPFEEIVKLIENQDYLSVTECACRVSVHACDKPREVCLVFGSPAKFLVERGRARKITKDEAVSILKKAEEAGLVHTTNNSADKANLICNCCPCCCTVLRGRTQLNHPHAFAPSTFMAAVVPDICTGCGICVENCPMHAIEMDATAKIDIGKCIGCGVCVSTCPVNAISLVERPDIPDTPSTTRDMAMKILKEKGKLEKFLKNMK